MKIHYIFTWHATIKREKEPEVIKHFCTGNLPIYFNDCIACLSGYSNLQSYRSCWVVKFIAFKLLFTVRQGTVKPKTLTKPFLNYPLTYAYKSTASLRQNLRVNKKLSYPSLHSTKYQYTSYFLSWIIHENDPDCFEAHLKELLIQINQHAEDKATYMTFWYFHHYA